MNISYPLAFKFVCGTGKGKDLGWEGGYVNHPKDPGGATNRGVTQNTYNLYRHSKGLQVRSVKLIEQDEVADIYRHSYWDKIKGDQLPVGVDLAVFDFAVNSGPSRAAKFLQAIVGVPADGVIGPATISAADKNQFGLVDRLCNERLRWLHTLKTFATFGLGWSRRVENLRATAKQMRKMYAEANPR